LCVPNVWGVTLGDRIPGDETQIWLPGSDKAVLLLANYATPHAAVSATGTGEFVMRSLAGRDVAERVARGESLDRAVEAVLASLGRDYDADVGLIAIDRDGTPVARHRTRDMPHAFFSGEGGVTARMRVA